MQTHEFFEIPDRLLLQPTGESEGREPVQKIGVISELGAVLFQEPIGALRLSDGRTGKDVGEVHQNGGADLPLHDHLFVNLNREVRPPQYPVGERLQRLYLGLVLTHQ